jgi:CheY-like chemotaxis protein
MAARNIMMVEDNPDDEKLILYTLKKYRLANDITVTRDGAEALDYLFCTGVFTGRAGEPLPQVVLLDIKLPKVSGLEVLQRIRADQRTRRLPVIILTSSDEEQDIIDSYELGANSYVRKPVEFTQFAEAVRQLGLYWLILNEPSPDPKTGEAG